MQLLAIVSGLLAVGASVTAVVYIYKYQVARANLEAVEAQARASTVLYTQTRAQLDQALESLREQLDREAAHEAEQAGTVGDATSAADFLNDTVRMYQDSASPSRRSAGQVPAAGSSPASVIRRKARLVKLLRANPVGAGRRSR